MAICDILATNHLLYISKYLLVDSTPRKSYLPPGHDGEHIRPPLQITIGAQVRVERLSVAISSGVASFDVYHLFVRRHIVVSAVPHEHAITSKLLFLIMAAAMRILALAAC